MDQDKDEQHAPLTEIQPDLSKDKAVEEKEDAAMEDKDDEMEDEQNLPNQSSNSSDEDWEITGDRDGRSQQRKRSYGTAYPCKLCPNSYRALGSFTSHMRTVHPSELTREHNFPCGYASCDKVLPTELGRKLHESCHKRKSINIKKELASSPLSDRPAKRLRTIQPPRRYSVLANTTLPSKSVDGLSTHQHHSTPLTSLNAPPVSEEKKPSGTVEKSSLPLSAAIFLQSEDNASNMLLIWSKTLEDDLLAAASHNKNNTILCIRDLDFYNMSKQQRNILKNGQRMNFIILEESAAYSTWTVMTFGRPIAPLGLEKKCFNSLLDVEKIFEEHAGSQGMDIVNVMRYTDDGFHHNLSQELSKKILIFNYFE